VCVCVRERESDQTVIQFKSLQCSAPIAHTAGNE